VRLDPLTRADAGPLLLAANEDRSSYAFTWAPGMQDEMEADVRAALDQQSSGEAVPFVMRRTQDSQVVGMTRFLDLGHGRPAGGPRRARA
jgi:RimJ/RimL family protein N-acetyltransferase